MKLGFKSVHPVSAFIFFVFAFFFCLAAEHPMTLAVSFVCGTVYDLKLQKKKTLSFLFKFILPLMLLVTLFNGLFSYYGATVLFTINSENYFTREPLIYGFVSAVRISAMLLWLDCFNEVVSNDKFIFLFGGISPRLALIISMVLRFIPLIRTQSAEISKAEKGIGNSVSSSRFTDKIRKASRRLSILVFRTLEKGIDTSDSMRARGYGLHGRTSYNSYVYSKKDLAITFFSIGAIILTFLSDEKFSASYNPIVDIYVPDMVSVFLIIFFAAILLMPTALDLREEKRWSISKSTI